MDEPITLTVEDLTALRWAIGNAWVPRFANPATREEAIGDLAGLVEHADDIRAERDRLQHVLADVFVALYSPDSDGLAGTVDYTELPEHVHRMRTDRDRLKAIVEDPEGSIAKTMEYLGEVEAERNRLRAEVAIQTNAADAAAEAVGAMAEKLSATLAENTRLRAVVDAARAFIALQVTEGHPPEDDHAAWMAMIAALEQLDVSPAMGGDDG